MKAATSKTALPRGPGGDHDGPGNRDVSLNRVVNPLRSPASARPLDAVVNAAPITATAQADRGFTKAGAQCGCRCGPKLLAWLGDPHVVGPAIFVLVFLFPALVTASFNVFPCTDRPIAGVRYLTQDLSLECGTPTHGFMKVLGAVVIAGAGFGIPLLLGVLLYRGRATLLITATFSALNALYDGYDIARGRYAWESVAMLRKMGAVLIGNLMTDPHAQLAAAQLLLLVMAFIQQSLRPFVLDVWVVLHGLSMESLLATLAQASSVEASLPSAPTLALAASVVWMRMLLT